MRIILIVDDDAAFLRALARVLRPLGHQLLLATDALTAMRAATHVDHIDLAILDLVLGNVSGPEIAARLVSIFPRMKVLYISGKIDLDPSVPFLSKPINMSTLIAMVQELLAGGTPEVDTLPSPPPEPGDDE